MRTPCLVSLALFLLVCGCNGPKTKPPDLFNIAQRVEDAGKAIANDADGAAKDVSDARMVVQDVGAAVDEQSSILRQSVPEAEAVVGILDKQTERLSNEAVPKLDDALEKVANIKTQADEVVASGVVVGQAAVDVGKIAKERDREKKRADDLEARLKSSAHSTLMWLIVVGVLVLAASGFVAIKVDMKSGIALAVGALMLVGAAAFVSQYLEYIKWGAAGLLLFVLLIAGWWLWQYMRGFWQTGNVVQKLKGMLPMEMAAAFFAEDGPVRAEVDDGQSKLFHKAVDKGKITRAS